MSTVAGEKMRRVAFMLGLFAVLPSSGARATEGPRPFCRIVADDPDLGGGVFTLHRFGVVGLGTYTYGDGEKFPSGPLVVRIRHLKESPDRFCRNEPELCPSRLLKYISDPNVNLHPPTPEELARYGRMSIYTYWFVEGRGELVHILELRDRKNTPYARYTLDGFKIGVAKCE